MVSSSDSLTIEPEFQSWTRHEYIPLPYIVPVSDNDGHPLGAQPQMASRFGNSLAKANRASVASLEKTITIYMYSIHYFSLVSDYQITNYAFL